MPITCARPLCGNNACKSSCDSGVESSIAEIARAMARISPERTRSTHCSIAAVTGTSVLQELPRDDQSLDLARAFADRAQLHVPVVLLRRIILDEAIAAVDLHRLVGAAHRHFAGIKLGH